MKIVFGGWEGLTSSVARCSEGIVGVGCVAVWSGRADFDTGGDILREGWRLVLAVMNGKASSSCQARSSMLAFCFLPF